MKKLLWIIVIVTLPLIAFFQFKNYRRFHPPVAYEYSISDSIDVDYHDQQLVEEYYQKAIEIGAFARTQWSSNGVDVRFPDASRQAELNAANYWNQLLTRVALVEQKLKSSFMWKSKGYGNQEIQLLESGIKEDKLKYIDSKEAIMEIAFGDQSRYVWLVQKELIKRGYEHKLDGLFGIDTQNAILTFQQDQNLYPSGVIDNETFEKLFLEEE